ncbi:unnamed protein product [Discosporangium mesarthrocarpum]
MSPLSLGTDIDCLRSLLSTGSPLLPEHYQWVYQNVKKDLHLASISGGTDILSCFVLGNPNLPVRAGELQCLGLGMDVCALKTGSHEGGLDGGEGGGSQVAGPGERGELACRTPFPSMPVSFWDDPGGSKYKSAYFTLGDNAWLHGDFIEVTEHRSVVISGRSDATLNPGGVRIGTAEIYRPVELLPEVADSLAVGHRVEGDVEVILFVKLLPPPPPQRAQPGSGMGAAGMGAAGVGVEVEGELATRIKRVVRESLTPRHVPSKIFCVMDVPYTRSGKKVEIAVTKAIHGESINNESSLVNAACLEEYREIGRKLRSKSK